MCAFDTGNVSGKSCKPFLLVLTDQPYILLWNEVCSLAPGNPTLQPTKLVKDESDEPELPCRSCCFSQLGPASAGGAELELFLLGRATVGLRLGERYNVMVAERVAVCHVKRPYVRPVYGRCQRVIGYARQ